VRGTLAKGDNIVPIVRLQDRPSYTRINNEVFDVVDAQGHRTRTLSFKATGLLCYLLSKPDKWKVSAKRIAASGVEGRCAILSAMKELREAGYLRTTTVVSKKTHRPRKVTYVYEHPSLNPEFSRMENRRSGNRTIGNLIT
jgi:hypothetical protein